jgi:hypothetical protein
MSAQSRCRRVLSPTASILFEEVFLGGSVLWDVDVSLRKALVSDKGAIEWDQLKDVVNGGIAKIYW